VSAGLGHVLEEVRGLTELEILALAEELYDWRRWARPEQLPPEGDWFVWLIQAGRGWGKTRTAAEFVREEIDAGRVRVVHAAAPTWLDVWSTMVFGSEDAPGLARVWPPHQAPVIVRDVDDPHLRCWNGAVIRLRSAKQADRFRGPQAELGWCDEVDSWKPDAMKPTEAFSLFELGIRLGERPRIVATSTPKPFGLVGELAARPDCVVTRGSTFANRRNLAERFLAMLELRYPPGHRLRRQEIEGERLQDVDGALFSLELLELARRIGAEVPRDFDRIVVAVDPPGGATECGIVAAGRTSDRAFVLRDVSAQLPPEAWADRAIALYRELAADRIVAEKNYGGDMVAATIRARDPSVPVTLITATRAKHQRAEPVSAKYALGSVGHAHHFPELERELSGFTPVGYEGDGSPNRADAAIWALTDLLLGSWGFEELRHLYPDLEGAHG
jgi:phage terminase large subunit-like protein